MEDQHNVFEVYCQKQHHGHRGKHIAEQRTHCQAILMDALEAHDYLVFLMFMLSIFCVFAMTAAVVHVTGSALS